MRPKHNYFTQRIKGTRAEEGYRLRPAHKRAVKRPKKVGLDMSGNKRIELKISGMACGGCSAAVEKALAGLDGVSSARVDLGEKTAYVEYDSARLSEQDFRRAVEAAGYKVE